MNDNETPLTETDQADNKSESVFGSLNYLYHLQDFANSWWNEADFRNRLLVILVFWLCINLILIHAAWRVYGTCLGDMFMKGDNLMIVMLFRTRGPGP